MFLVNKKISSYTVINAKEFIDKKTRGDNLILVNSTEKISQKYNLLLLQKTQQALHTSDVFSFKSFISFVIKQHFGFEIIDEITENELIIKSIIEGTNNSTPNNYNYFTQISAIIKGLREDGIRSVNLKDDLINNLEHQQYDVNKLSNLIQIMQNFEFQLEKTDSCDYPKAMDLIISNIQNIEYLKDKLILFNEFQSFRRPDLDLLNELSKHNEIIVNSNFSLENGPYIGDKNFFILDLKSLGFKLYESKEKEIDIKEFEKDLGYNGSVELISKKRKEKYNLHSYINIREEVYGITKLVKHLLLNPDLNYKPSDICVVSRDVEAYSLLIREFFADNDIPANISDRYKLSKSPVAVVIVNILEAAINNYSYDSLRQILDSAYINTGIKKPKQLLNLAKKYRIIGGLPESTLETFILQLNGRLKNLNIAKSSSDNSENFKQYFFDMEIAEIESITENFSELAIKFKNFDNVKLYSIEEFITLINRIIKDFRMEEQILKLRDRFNKEGISFNDKLFFSERIEKDARALYKFLETLDKLRKIEITNNVKYSLVDLVEKLKGIMSITRYSIREKKGFGVDVTSIEQTRGLDYKVKIMTGAVEGMMPVVFQTDRLIGKIMIESELRHYYQEFIQFYEFINDKDAEIYIFSHREDNTQSRITSHFISPIENNDYSNIYVDNAGLEWQNSIINSREKLLLTNIDEVEEYENIIKRNERYSKSEDLQFDIFVNELDLAGLIENESFSATEITNFKSYCYNYFYERKLKLSSNPDIEIFLNNLELGNLIHQSIESTLNAFVSKYQDRIKNILDPNDNQYPILKLIKLESIDKDEILLLFKKTAIDLLSKYDSQHQFFAIESNLLIGDDNESGILIKWFESIIARHIFDNKLILATEFKFKNIKIEHIAISVNFSGTIDRVDISEDLKEIKVIDYKLSDSTNDGLQLVIYAKVMQKLLLEIYNVDTEIIELTYDSFKFSSKTEESEGVLNILEKSKVKSLKIDELFCKVLELVKQIFLLDFSTVKSKHQEDFMSKEIKLLKRD